MVANLYVSQWKASGWAGAPGYTAFHYNSVDPSVMASNFTKERTLMLGLQFSWPSTLVYTPPSSFRVVDAATGELEDIKPNTGILTGVAGTGTASHAAPSGYSVNWLTATPAVSRLVVGRTYFVPAAGQVYDGDGTLLAAQLTALTTAVNAFAAGVTPIFVVWRRPVGGVGGSVAPVLAARINDRVSILKSRRA